MLSRVMKLVGIGLVSLSLTACATRYVIDEYTEEATRGLLLLCINAPVGEVGLTNESLARAYLTSTESLMVCKGVSKSINNE